MKVDPLYIIIVVVAMGAGIWRESWLHGVARSIAEGWLREHQYKVISIRTSWFGSFRFAPKLFRNTERTAQFRCEVEDTQLGGTGVVWLRVWTDRAGLIAREPDVEWETQPFNTDPDFIPGDTGMEAAQRALLKRIARGEVSFAAPRRSADGGEAFDMLVEHLMAMRNRGLITAGTPRPARTPGAMYELVDGVELTDEGRAYLATFDTQLR